MKKFVIALMLMTAIISCKKTDTDLPLEQAIIGKWELRNSLCGWSGSKDYPAGNFNTITFHTNGAFTATGILADSGVYSIRVDTNAQNQTVYLLSLSGNPNREVVVKVDNNKLKLDENAFIADGCEYNYLKL